MQTPFNILDPFRLESAPSTGAWAHAEDSAAGLQVQFGKPIKRGLWGKILCFELSPPHVYMGRDVLRDSGGSPGVQLSGTTDGEGRFEGCWQGSGSAAVRYVG